MGVGAHPDLPFCDVLQVFAARNQNGKIVRNCILFFTFGRKWVMKRSQTYSHLGKEKIKHRGKYSRVSLELGM